MDDKVDINEHALQLYMHRRRMALINESNVLNYLSVYQHFDGAPIPQQFRL